MAYCRYVYTEHLDNVFPDNMYFYLILQYNIKIDRLQRYHTFSWFLCRLS